MLPQKGRVALGATLAVLTCGMAGAHAQDDTDALRAQIEALRGAMTEMQTAYEQQVDALEQRLEQLEARPAPAAVATPARQVPATGAAPLADALSYSAGDVSLGIGMNIDVAAGGSTASNAVLKEGEAGLQGGGHDPNKNGFTLQAAELVVAGAVDPYFDARATMVFLLDQEGETVVELEEAWAQTRGLPSGLQVRAGHYYTEFGRINPMHLHSWDFVDQPFIITRMFGGDGQRAPGARVSWLAPFPWYSEFIVGAQNCNGETMPSFCGEEGIGGFENAILKSRNFSDALTYSGRWLNGFDLSDTVSVNVGTSVAYGPNRTGPGNDTLIVGGDLYAKWQPERTERGFPFVAWQTEALYRDYEAGFDVDRTTLSDWGFYTQALWGFEPGWVAGLRFGYGDGSGENPAEPRNDDLNRSKRYRISPNITWYPTEFSKIRLQYNHDWSEALPGAGVNADITDPATASPHGSHTADTIWLQLGVALGAHGAHTF